MKTWLIIYGVMSVVTLLAYLIDKIAAMRGRRRISECFLHAFEFGCGWPGALLGQYVFRHKSSKKGYRIVFWILVVLNIGLVWWLSSSK